MLERTTRTFDDFLQEHNLVSLENKRNLRRKLTSTQQVPNRPNEGADEHNMTRKTRTRRPRIAVIQSGYCAVCNVPYNSVEDHIQSKKHLKLIGEDANYIALNGSLNGFLHTNSIPFLNLNGIDAIGVHDTSLDDFSPRCKRRNMPKARTVRAVSVASDRIKSSPLSPTGSDTTGHHLRSRRNINYMTPPLDDDSLQETPDISLPDEPIQEHRELRSSTTRVKPPEQNHDEVWTSGRPKRACISRKRLSLDERSPSNCKIYYKVEVMTKSRSNQKEHEANKRHKSQSPKREEDKGLIVKFKKLRNSELIRLNNEATNFLFPKRDESSEDDDDDDTEEEDESKSTVKSTREKNFDVVSEASEECSKNIEKFKVEDDVSMDSTCSTSNKGKKKRRTHAEAFIMDNQKYYKFETPGSRLRYQGSYLPPIVKSPKHNGECSLKGEDIYKSEEPQEKKPKTRGTELKLENYKFSFEKVPKKAPWYEVFQRVDRGEQHYAFFSDYFWDPFILPYQMPHITPLDHKACIHHYNILLKEIKSLKEPNSESESTCTSPEPSVSTSSPSLYDPEQDEDSKMSATTVSSNYSTEEPRRKRLRRTKTAMLQQLAPGKNPRKSPRQHASTLAILSSLIHQRKRRSKNKGVDESLPPIPEEVKETEDLQETEKTEKPPEEGGSSIVKPKSPYRRFKPKIDYVSIANKIEDELNAALDDYTDYDLDILDDDIIDFHNSKTNTAEILRLFDETKANETEKSCRRFFNGTPGRKPGRKKKKNLTGWPKQKKVGPKREQSKEKDNKGDNDNNSTTDSVSVNNESDAEDEPNSTDSVKKNEGECGNEKTGTNKVLSGVRQPYVCVQKLDNKMLGKQVCTPKQTVRKQRRMPASPRSPRVLRKPRGRWYKER